MHTTPLAPAPQGPERYIVAVQPAGLPLYPNAHEGHVYFEFGDYALVAGDDYGHALSRAHECGRTGKMPAYGRPEVR